MILLLIAYLPAPKGYVLVSIVDTYRQHEHIRSLSVPVIPISAKTIVMPLIGTLDYERISFLRERALSALNDQKARKMIWM